VRETAGQKKDPRRAPFCVEGARNDCTSAACLGRATYRYKHLHRYRRFGLSDGETALSSAEAGSGTVPRKSGVGSIYEILCRVYNNE
jgi:hypothetical protein